MLVRIEAFLRRFARLFNRDEWTVRLLNRPRQPGRGTRPGLVLIQIDGLAFAQMERALRQGNMPFLNWLIRKDGYREFRHYTGLPSNTPAVQGMLFYGVKSCVPAFGFKDSETGLVYNMFTPDSAGSVEKRLKDKGGRPLLEGGSAYGNIFTGGAGEAHFCAASMGWGSLLKAANPLGIPISVLLHLFVFVRALVLTLIEFALSIVDCLKGILSGKDFAWELSFIPMRVTICVVLREIIAAGAKSDIARGLPVVQLNFAGYDEQSHHRGPRSNFAHWSLRGIDSAIAGVWKAARTAHLRDYDVFIYSDHGQEQVTSYREENGRTIDEAVDQVFKETVGAGSWLTEFNPADPYWRARALRNPAEKKPSKTAVPPPIPEEKNGEPPRAVVTAMGNVGLIYPPYPLSFEEREALALGLVNSAKIPFVATADGGGRAVAWNSRGKFSLPEEAAQVIDPEHPFLEEAGRDLVDLCHHPDAGELLIFGWRKGPTSLTFYDEQGSHAGVGPQETSGFALLPADAMPRLFGPTIRTPDLREACFRSMRRGEAGALARSETPGVSPASVRIMTYNVHSCMGRDGKVSPERIARVIARHHPDIIALQELSPTQDSHQSAILAEILTMTFHFHPSFFMKKGPYGNAVFSRFPMRPIRADSLPKLAGGGRLLEPRGALWVEIDCGGKKAHLLNTHLSLSSREGLLQAEALLGPDWLGNPACDGPVILCGDLNALPASKICESLGRRLKNAQAEAPGRNRPLKTLPSFYPMGSVDHVFVGPGIRVLHAEAPGTELEKVSSDHLPLIIELELP